MWPPPGETYHAPWYPLAPVPIVNAANRCREKRVDTGGGPCVCMLSAYDLIGYYAAIVMSRAEIDNSDDDILQ